MSFPNWSDSVTKVYNYVQPELLARIKTQAKGTKLISVKSCPMPGSRNYFRVEVKSSAHSWVASSNLLAEFWCGLTEEDRTSLSRLLA